MNAIRKYIVEELMLPVDCYNYYVKMVTSVDGGKSFWYCGNGKYFRTKEEAEAWKREKEGECVC